jgi:hypothetical protein
MLAKVLNLNLLTINKQIGRVESIAFEIPHCAYTLWRVNGYQQGFRFFTIFGLGGQEIASKPPQAICKPLGNICSKQTFYLLLTLVT